MDQEQIGNAAEPLERLGFVGDNGLAAPIAAGGDDGKSEIAQQQMMERCARQHDAEGTIAGRDQVGQSRDATRQTTQQYDWRRRGFERLLLGLQHLGQASRHVDRVDHQREGLARPMLAYTQLRHGGLVARVDQKLESAQTFQRDDGAAAQSFGHLGERVGAFGNGRAIFIP